MPLAICGVAEVPAYAQAAIDHVISIRAHNQNGPDLLSFQEPFELHSFVFDDTATPNQKDGPTEERVRRLVEVLQKIPFDSNVLFHCFAGVSRSTAAAFLWLVHHGISYSAAYAHIVRVRGPFVSPNQLIVKLADPIMGQGGKMAAFISAELGRRAPERQAYFDSHS